MPLQLDCFDLLEAPAGLEGGAPLQLRLDDIDEDPAQPRVEFDAAALEELAVTIRRRGVRQPISVRRHPTSAGRWMLNFGARRYRASRLAGAATIPAFEDAAVDDYDQVIENEQRASLTPLELALFVQRRMRVGDTASEIAERLGKSRTFVTMVCALVDPPEWVMHAYRSGRCRGMTELYELRRLYEADPAQVSQHLGDAGAITRQRLAPIKQAVAGRRDPPLVAATQAAASAPRSAADTAVSAQPSTSAVAAWEAAATMHVDALASLVAQAPSLPAADAASSLADLRRRLAAL